MTRPFALLTIAFHASMFVVVHVMHVPTPQNLISEGGDVEKLFDEITWS